ncbi:hypothetical protein BIZ35_01765 [Heyndrickxia coagulans]|uniref:Uncharacterized protein n=1 Tax=Heyndrickxia coagulans TaxID=1398 RepID=A0A133KL37_HEYCO|nr:hypothetical protein BIZ35_01765 [Heyndrickxia coagulans]KWZ80241.1 hypothetical protein HMPREF3213_02351 [Heyndrickxia coagulans]
MPEDHGYGKFYLLKITSIKFEPVVVAFNSISKSGPFIVTSPADLPSHAKLDGHAVWKDS